MSAPADPATLAWSAGGLARSPAKTVALLLLIPFSAGLGLVWTGGPLFLLLGPAFLAPVLSRYFLAPRYVLGAETARASWGTMQTEIRWADIRRVLRTGDGLRLSPLAGDDLRQRFRGVELALPKDPIERERVLARVRESLPPEAVYDAPDGEPRDPLVPSASDTPMG